MTFDDDFIQLRLSTGPLRVTCRQLGIDWPPPERIAITGGPFSVPVFRRVSCSDITDEQRQEATRVRRGAEYVHDVGANTRIQTHFRRHAKSGAVVTLRGAKRVP